MGQAVSPGPRLAPRGRRGAAVVPGTLPRRREGAGPAVAQDPGHGRGRVDAGPERALLQLLALSAGKMTWARHDYIAIVMFMTIIPCTSPRVSWFGSPSPRPHLSARMSASCRRLRSRMLSSHAFCDS